MDSLNKKVTDLIAELDLLDIKLTIENGALRFNAPKGAMTQSLREKITANKQDIIAFLSEHSLSEHSLINDASQIAGESPIPIQSRERGLPLSTAQQRFWFLDQLDHGNSTAFNMPPMVIRLNGVLNIEALQRALDEIIQRHEVLRSAFRMENGVPVQIAISLGQISISHNQIPLASNQIIVIPIHDIRTLDENSQQIEIKKITLNEANTPFDLKSGGILLRVVLVQTQEYEHYFILTMHHIISDGWSIGLFVREIGLLYRAFLNSNKLAPFHNPLPPLPIQYADFAYWERSRLNETRMEHQKIYWIEQLKGAPTLLELPTDHQRPRIRRNHGRSEHFYLEPDIAIQLQDFCKKNGLTPYMALLASFGVLLCRYTGQEEIVIGSPISVRPHSQTEELIGLFLNTIALRIDLSGNPSFSELAQRVKKLTLGAYQNSEFPFDMILQELNLERSLNHTPLFQVLFALQNAPMGQVELEGLTITPMPPGEELISPFDLVLSIDDIGSSTGKFRYNTDLFEAPTIIRMVGHYKNLLANMLSNQNEPIRYLQMIPTQEIHQLQKWQGGTLADGVRVGKNYFPVTETITKIFENQAAKNPDSVALTLTTNNITYRELNERANCLAHKIMSLNELNVREVNVKEVNVRIGLCMERSVELVIGILAILKAGGAYVPLDPAYPDERLRFIVKDAGIKIIVGSPELIAPLELESIIVVNPADSVINSADSKLSADDNFAPSSNKTISLIFDNPSPQSSPESIAYVIYTSGSTGLPKGVLVTHANVVRLFTGTDQLFGFTNKDVWTLFHSFAFDFSVWELWGALLYGGRLVVVPYRVSRSPDAFYDLLLSECVTVLNQTPSAFRQLIEVDGRVYSHNDGSTLPISSEEKTEVSTPITSGKEIKVRLSLKWVIFGGEALEPRTLQPWVQRHGLEQPQIINMYGITETTVHVTFHRITAADVEGGGSPIGRSLPDLCLLLVDNFNQPVPIGVAGEMLVGGAGVSNGYLNRPELTSTRFIDSESVGIDASVGKLYRSGDLARWLSNADGVLEYLGRMDMQVKIRGFRIELGEIEGCLVSHPRVREAVVEPRKSYGNKGTASKGTTASEDTSTATISLIAYITLEGDDQKGLTGELRQYLGHKLPDYMVPASIVVMEHLPLTTNGKIDRRALPEPDSHRPDLKVELVLPRTPLESMLADLWSEILGIKTIGVDDNFFELGGDSIKGVIFTNKLQEKISSVVYVVALFEAPTIRELVAYLHQHYTDAIKNLLGFDLSDGINKLGSDPSDTIDQKDSVFENTRKFENTRITEEAVSMLAKAIKPIAPFSYTNKKRNPQAIFVLAPPRSGTTLMRVLLGGHPKLFAPPELELLLFNTLDERKAVCSGRDSFWLEGTLRAVMEILNIDSDTAKQLMAEREERGMSVKDFYGEMQSWLSARSTDAAKSTDASSYCLSASATDELSFHKNSYHKNSCERILVDKSPSYALDLAVLERAEEYFENSLYIHLHRHPYGMIHSFEEANLHQIFFRHPHNFASRQLAELIWIQSHRNITRFLATVPLERQINIGFAEMTGSPEETVKRLCQFIGIDFTPEMLQIYEAKEKQKRMTDGIHAESKMLGDIKFHTHKRIEASAAERWRDKYKEDFLGEPAWDMALALGYSRDVISNDDVTSNRDSITSNRNGITSNRDGITSNRDSITSNRDSITLNIEKSDGGLPLSFAQQRLWFLDQLEGAGTAYNMPVALRVKGDLNIDVLAATFRAITKRHEGLRSRFETVDGVPVVRISPKANEMIIIDLSQMGYEEQTKKINELLAEDATTPFDLTCGPLFRSTLLILGEQDFIILFNMHHIVSDGWSMGILVREWQKLYNSILEYRDTEQKDNLTTEQKDNLTTEQQDNLTFHYVDYARRQRCWVAQGGLQRDIDYWKKQLKGVPALLELPTDRQRPPIQRFNGKTIEFTISPELTKSLKGIADKAGASLYMVLLSAFGVLLMRYSGQKDVVIGSPTANRTTKEVEGIIGFFVNTLVMRLAVEPELTFAQFLSKVRATALEAYAHQEVPFEKLVEEIRPERNLSYSPLFQVMFSMQSDPAPVPTLKGVEVTVIEQPTNISKYDLTLSVTENNRQLTGFTATGNTPTGFTATGLTATLEFNTDLFNLDTMERLSGHFVRLLEGIISFSSLPLSKLPLLTESEYRYLVYDLNNTVQPLPKAQTIHGLFEEQVIRTPDAIALQFGYKPSGEDHQYLTYNQLNCRANQIAHCLINMGVVTGTTVAIAIERSPDMVAGLLGILKTGAAYIPLDPTYPKDRIAYILDNAGVQVLLTQASLLAGLPEHNGKTVCIDMDQCAESDCNAVVKSETIIVVKPETIIVVKPETIAVVKPEDLAYVIYTSGSTGNPKGVMIPHGAAVNFINSMAKTPGITSNDRLLAVTTISFDIAVLELYTPLSVGARVVIATEEMTRDGEMLTQALSAHSISIMQATPATWRLMIASGWKADELTPNTVDKVETTQKLKILCGGEALPGTLAAQLLPRSKTLWNLYGPTETTVWSTLHQVTDTSDAKAQPIGRPIDNTTLYILDEAMNPVPMGVAGELYIGGSGLARGYWKRPDLTNEKFVPDPFFISDNEIKMYRTGDLARYRANGVVDYLGRIDHQVKFRGFRIELGEIEHALTKLEGVAVGAVVAEKDVDNAIKRLVAFYVPEFENSEISKQKLTPLELRSGLQKSLPDYMVPGLFVEVNKMPLTPNGKIDRRALSIPDSMTSSRTYYNQRQGHDGSSFDNRIGSSDNWVGSPDNWVGSRDNWVGSRDNLEFQLIRIWEEVLEVKPIGIRDNFFDLGGHSLIAVRLMAQITRQFKQHLPLAALFQGSTVEAMAKLLREDKQKDDGKDKQEDDGKDKQKDKSRNVWSSLVPIQPKGDLTPFFCIPGAGGNVVYLHDLAREMGIRPFYGLQPPGLDGVTTPHTQVETLATHYIGAIKEVQPHGPYLIGGHSFGGLVAFEMIKQLQTQGETVEALVLIDTPAPRFFEPTGKDWDEARWLTQVADIAGHQYRTSLNIKYETLQTLTPEQQLSFVHQRLKECDVLPPDAELVHFRGFIEVYKANLQAVYRPFGKVSSFKFILLRSRDEQPENIASAVMHELRAIPDLGWGEYSTFNQFYDITLNVIEIPGDHLTMLRPPNVGTMVCELNKFL